MKVIDLKNKIIAIIGAGGDIGTGITKILAEAGSTTLIIDINTSKGEKLTKEINNIFGKSSEFEISTVNRSFVRFCAANLMKLISLSVGLSKNCISTATTMVNLYPYPRRPTLF